MALTNYSDLKEAAIKWSRRSDISDIIDDAIDLAEAEMYKNGPDGQTGLELRDMESRETAVLDSTTPSRYLALPDRFAKMRSFQLVVSGTIPNRVVRELEYKIPSALLPKGGQGIPKFFTITSQIEFDIHPLEDYTVEMELLKKETALSAANPTNQIMTRFPDIYLNGTLWGIFDSVRNEELAQYRYTKFRAAIAAANQEDKKGRYGITPRMRSRGSTP